MKSQADLLLIVTIKARQVQSTRLVWSAEHRGRLFQFGHSSPDAIAVAFVTVVVGVVVVVFVVVFIVVVVVVVATTAITAASAASADDGMTNSHPRHQKRIRRLLF